MDCQTALPLFSILLLAIAGCHDQGDPCEIEHIREIRVEEYPWWSIDIPEGGEREGFFVVTCRCDTLDSLLEVRIDSILCRLIEEKPPEIFDDLSISFLKRTDYTDKLDSVQIGVTDATNIYAIPNSETFKSYNWKEGRYSVTLKNQRLLYRNPPPCWEGGLHTPWIPDIELYEIP